jgi:hypothetical protein
MQTFLPYADFERSLACLDRARLGKQRVETFQIISTIENNKKAWSNHPAVLMWHNCIPALKHYYNLSLEAWADRGYKNIKLTPITIEDTIVYPEWFGLEAFHLSHQSNLIRKNAEYYRPIFGEDVSDALPYYWPTQQVV